MSVLFEKAPGKIILFGEHAVVYGQPAIAIPVTRVNATARVIPDLASEHAGIHVQALDIGLDADLEALSADDPLAKAIRLTLEELALIHIPAFTLQITSTIPIAAGMGSSAAISVAIIRALSAYLGKPFPPDLVSALAYEVEKIQHGTPSGIDNNVIAYQQPVFFRRDNPTEFLHIEQPTHWVIADTGETTPTRETVSDVNQLITNDPVGYGALIQRIGSIVEAARTPLIEGDLQRLGQLLYENQDLLEELEVSSSRLEILIKAARRAGAAGAKLSGGGRGGNMIALAPEKNIAAVEKALIEAGAKTTLMTTLTPWRIDDTA